LEEVFKICKGNINDTDIKSKIAPVKQFERTYEKFNEYKNDTKYDFPLYMLRDISRCTIVCKKFQHLYEFYKNLEKYVSQNKDRFEIIEVKNGFIDDKNDDNKLYKLSD